MVPDEFGGWERGPRVVWGGEGCRWMGEQGDEVTSGRNSPKGPSFFVDCLGYATETGNPVGGVAARHTVLN